MQRLTLKQTLDLHINRKFQEVVIWIFRNSLADRFLAWLVIWKVSLAISTQPAISTVCHGNHIIMLLFFFYVLYSVGIIYIYRYSTTTNIST